MYFKKSLSPFIMAEYSPRSESTFEAPKTGAWNALGKEGSYLAYFGFLVLSTLSILRFKALMPSLSTLSDDALISFDLPWFWRGSNGIVWDDDESIWELMAPFLTLSYFEDLWSSEPLVCSDLSNPFLPLDDIELVLSLSLWWVLEFLDEVVSLMSLETEPKAGSSVAFFLLIILPNNFMVSAYFVIIIQNI